jgi:GH24 family phage-related lysozyme (muramidase)
LGQRNARDLKALNLGPELTARLTPYLGFKRGDAQAFLGKNPLSVSDEEAQTINKAVKADILNKTVKNYNDATARNYGADTAPRFQDLPREAQTAILSAAFQYGDLASRTPNYWKQITNGDWQGAHGNLMDFKDAHRSRREKEAAKLREAIDSGRMPGAPPPRVPVR